MMTERQGTMDDSYLELLSHVLEHGERRADRTGTGTLGLFGATLRCKLDDEFPLLTSKRVHWHAVVQELLWFISGSTNIRPLLQQKVRIWSEWPHKAYLMASQPPLTLREFENAVISDERFAETWGDLGPVYGAAWRRWPCPGGGSMDQLVTLENMMRTEPWSRRMVLTAWNPATNESAALPPCHILSQFHIDGQGRLSCLLFQRSADLFLGVPFNIASYALLTCLLARSVNLRPGDLVHVMGDAHIYVNHVDQVREQLSRRNRLPPPPTLELSSGIGSVTAYTAEDIILHGYLPLPTITAPVAI